MPRGWRPFGWEIVLVAFGVSAGILLGDVDNLDSILFWAIAVAIGLAAGLGGASVTWLLLHYGRTRHLRPLNEPDLEDGEAVTHDVAVHFAETTSGLFYKSGIARMWLTNRRIMILPARRSVLRAVTTAVADTFFSGPCRYRYLLKSFNFRLNDVTLVRPTLGIFQIKFDGWAVGLIEDRFPWWTAESAPAQRSLMDAIERAVAQSRAEMGASACEEHAWGS